jgi:hypothetical protein
LVTKVRLEELQTVERDMPENCQTFELQLRRDLRERHGMGKGGVDRALGNLDSRALRVPRNGAAPLQHCELAVRLGNEILVAITIFALPQAQA